MTDPLTLDDLQLTDADAARFWAKVDKGDGDGCWLWTAARTVGYGRFSLRNKAVMAHRIGYLLGGGVIPGGLVLDHLCRTPACVRMEHLEPVSDRTNVLRGEGITARQARASHCHAGHPLEGENLYVIVGRRARVCRICQRRRQREWRARQRQRQEAAA